MEDNSAVYETNIIDMIQEFELYINELKSKNKLDTYESGKLDAYNEFLDIVKTRHEIIWDVCHGDD